MPRKQDDEEKKETKIPDPCGRIDRGVHSRSIAALDIIVVAGSGDTKHVGIMRVCLHGFFTPDGMEDCNHCESVKWFRSRPSSLSDSIFESLAKRGHSYWLKSAMHVAQTQDGVWHNFNDLASVPPFKDESELTESSRRVLIFRARHDPGLPEDVRKLFGRFEAAATPAVVTAALNKPGDAQEDVLEGMPVLIDKLYWFALGSLFGMFCEVQSKNSFGCLLLFAMIGWITSEA